MSWRLQQQNSKLQLCYAYVLESTRRVLPGCMVHSVAAVSYTHLDVYKRQQLLVDLSHAEEQVLTSFLASQK